MTEQPTFFDGDDDKPRQFCFYEQDFIQETADPHVYAAVNKLISLGYRYDVYKALDPTETFIIFEPITSAEFFSRCEIDPLNWWSEINADSEDIDLIEVDDEDEDDEGDERKEVEKAIRDKYGDLDNWDYFIRDFERTDKGLHCVVERAIHAADVAEERMGAVDFVWQFYDDGKPTDVEDVMKDFRDET